MVSEVSNEANLRTLGAVALLAGAVQALAGVALYVVGVYFAPWSMLVSVLVLLACIVAGTRLYAARRPGGEIGYAQAFAAGVAISVGTGLVYAVYNVLSISFVYPHFLDDMVRAQIAMADARGLAHPPFEVLRAGAGVARVALPNLVRLSLIGTVLSAVSAFFLRTRR